MYSSVLFLWLIRVWIIYFFLHHMRNDNIFPRRYARPAEVNVLIYYYPRLVRIAVFGTNPSFERGGINGTVLYRMQTPRRRLEIRSPVQTTSPPLLERDRYCVYFFTKRHVSAESFGFSGHRSY